jgi:hypothetical protein
MDVRHVRVEVFKSQKRPTIEHVRVEVFNITFGYLS